MDTVVAEPFAVALLAAGPEPERAPHMTLYDRLLGSWALESVDHRAPAGRLVQRGEVHFAWVLEGRAIQDVWIVPDRRARALRMAKVGNRYGTTLRVYDPETDSWRITWFNPVNGAVDRLVGRSSGEDIVQVGRRDDGQWIRWSFVRITPGSFHWLGESSADGATWQLDTEFSGRRA